MGVADRRPGGVDVLHSDLSPEVMTFHLEERHRVAGLGVDVEPFVSDRARAGENESRIVAILASFRDARIAGGNPVGEHRPYVERTRGEQQRVERGVRDEPSCHARRRKPYVNQSSSGP